MTRLLFTGTGRCGTGYVAAALNACGVRCGHEQVYTLQTALRDTPPVWGHWQAESSWLAAPRLWNSEVKALHLVRHPLAYVRSALEIGLFHDARRSAYTDAIYRHMPAIERWKDPANRALAMWAWWNGCIGAYTTDYYRIEDFGLATLAEVLHSIGHGRSDLPAIWAKVANDPGARNLKTAEKPQRLESVATSLFQPKLLDEARKLSAHYGYAGW